MQCIVLVCDKGQRKAGIYSQVCDVGASVHLTACFAYLSKGESWIFSELFSSIGGHKEELVMLMANLVPELFSG